MLPYRVALCITDLEVGGAEVALVELATRLDRARFWPVVYCLGPRPKGPEASCAARLQAAGIAVHCLGARRWRDAAWAIPRLAGLLRAQRPHLVQSFLFHANLAGRIAARLAGVPRVVAGIRVAERHAAWHLWLDRLTARWVDRYVCVSQAVAEFSVRKGRLPRQRVVVIPNGVDATRYPASQAADLTQFGISPQSKVVAFVGRLEPQKGVDWLLETALRWLRPADCHLLVVGQGPSYPELLAIARRLGLSSQVHFVGWRRDVPEILAASTLLVLPSRWEGMANVLLEAMASGLPVVATDVEGVREVLADSSDLQVVPFGDTERFAGRVKAILENPRLAASLGQANRKRVECAFSIEGTVASYQRLWESLIACGQGPEKEKSLHDLGPGRSPQPDTCQNPMA